MALWFKGRCIMWAATIFGLSAAALFLPPQAHGDGWIEAFRYAIAANGAEGDWRGLPPREQKERLREWRSMSPRQRRELRDRMDRLKRMPDADRRLYERRYHQWKGLPPEERRRLLQKLDRWESLPPEEQEAIRQRFRNH
jgi:hypothetical protein